MLQIQVISHTCCFKQANSEKLKAEKQDCWRLRCPKQRSKTNNWIPQSIPYWANFVFWNRGVFESTYSLIRLSARSFESDKFLTNWFLTFYVFWAPIDYNHRPKIVGSATYEIRDLTTFFLAHLQIDKTWILLRPGRLPHSSSNVCFSKELLYFILSIG